MSNKIINKIHKENIKNVMEVLELKDGDIVVIKDMDTAQSLLPSLRALQREHKFPQVMFVYAPAGLEKLERQDAIKVLEGIIKHGEIINKEDIGEKQ